MGHLAPLLLISFVQQHPAAFIAFVGMLLPILLGIIGYFFKRTLDMIVIADANFREELKGLALSMAHQNEVMDAKLDRLSELILSQERRLSSLEGEHSILSKHHYAMLRKTDYTETHHRPENGGGD